MNRIYLDSIFDKDHRNGANIVNMDVNYLLEMNKFYEDLDPGQPLKQHTISELKLNVEQHYYNPDPGLLFVVEWKGKPDQKESNNPQANLKPRRRAFTV